MLSLLPNYYKLYDPEAAISLKINSSGTGNWQITKGEGITRDTTYVTQYNPADPSAYTNVTSNSTVGHDYTHTIVWFAVVWDRTAHPDTVVIDYGLPVDIDVLHNDTFGDYGRLEGVGPLSEAVSSPKADSNFGNTYNAKYGDVSVVETGTEGSKVRKVRYALRESNSMMMDGKDEFSYSVRYTGGDTEAAYFYGKVTVIPATTIYYEDNFLTFDTHNVDGTEITSNWTIEGTVMENATQDEDRPGQFSLENIDANNVYGHDGAYADTLNYSLGTARKTTVYQGTYSTASFSFTGTGFDVISVTSDKTGAINVTVTNRETGAVTRKVVDTYYGYVYNAVEDTWEVDPNADSALYQIPVMKIEKLPYGTYDVVIRAAYSNLHYHGQGTTDGKNSYDFYLDAIRIYDPANDGANDKDIEAAYKADKEGWPEYHELRNKILAAGNFTAGANLNEAVYGIVYIDGKSEDVKIDEYKAYGPNNEVYLTEGKAVAFKLALTNVDNIADVQIAVKSADGQQIIASCFNVNAEGVIFNKSTRTMNTSTDQYYSAYTQCTAGDGQAVIVLQNTGKGIMSVTNIKITYKSDPNGTSAATFMMLPEEAHWVLMALSLDQQEPEVTEPEVTEPEVTEPEVTEPEVTEPEVTEPEATEPEYNEPEETKPSNNGSTKPNKPQKPQKPSQTEEKSFDQICAGVRKNLRKAVEYLLNKWY